MNYQVDVIDRPAETSSNSSSLEIDNTMNFGDLQPGDLFTFKPRIGMPWSDRKLYRKATDRTYHCASKVLSI